MCNKVFNLVKLFLYFVKEKRKNFFFCFLFFIFSLFFTKYYFLFTNEYYLPSCSEYISEYKADKVFQKRILTVLAAKAISVCTNLSLDHSLKVICTITCVAILYGFNLLIQKFVNKKIHPYWSFFVFIPIGWNYIVLNSIYHSYDLTSLAFFTWGLLLFLEKKYILFYLTFIIGCFNRESTCFISIAVFSVFFKLPIKISVLNLFKFNNFILYHLFFQFLIWISIKTYLEHLFRFNPGQFYEETLSMMNFFNDIWKGNPSWPYLNTATLLGNPRCYLTLFAGVWILIPIHWRYIPTNSKRLLWVIPPYLIVAILYANLMESRVYQEVNIILSLVVVSGFVNRKNYIYSSSK